MAGGEEFYPWYIANCVLNAFLSYTAIMLNSATIHATRKTSSLPKTLKTLLLSLCVSDLGVGLFAQPLNIAFLVMKFKQIRENDPALGVQCRTSIGGSIVDPSEYRLHDRPYHLFYLRNSYSISKLQDIHGRTTPYTSNPSSSGAASGTKCSNGNCREICGHFNLHIYRVFGLLFTKRLYFVHYGHKVSSTECCYTELYNNGDVSQFIP